MSITISSNQAASYTALNMKRSNNLLTKSLQRLSSGKRIVSPADDAGGLAVGLKLQSSLKRSAASLMNTQNGVSFLQMQDGVMKVIGEILDRMSELKAFYNDISKSKSDRETYNHEFNELQKELKQLKSQKFNGVSLFATTERDLNSLKIDTSDDGLGEKIDLKRTGFFENLKSKFGVDGVLNSGSHGSYRQLVGNFTEDGGPTSADPNHTSRAYGSGEVVFKQGTSPASSGYFMALTDVKAGTLIEDNGGASSLWIKLADQDGNGFSEAYPEAAEFDPFSMKRTADGRAMSYLKGDIVRVPAHWDSKGSYFYLEAQTDVPYGKTLNALYKEGQVGPNKFFDYVGENSSGIPTTEFVRANSLLADPSLFSPTNVSSFINLFNSHQDNNYTPGHVKVLAADDPAMNGPSSPTVNSAVRQIDTISTIQGGVQDKEVIIENIVGNEQDAYEVTVTAGSFSYKFSVQDDTDNDPKLNTDVSQKIVNELNNIDFTNGVFSIVPAGATNQAFNSNATLNSVTIAGQPGVGDFSISVNAIDGSPDTDDPSYDWTKVVASGGALVENGITYQFHANGTVGTGDPGKFWGDGSTVSATTPGQDGDYYKNPTTNTFWYADSATGSDLTDATTWTNTNHATLVALENDPNFNANIRKPAGAAPFATANDGDLVAKADVRTVHEYIADNYDITVNSFTLNVNYVAGNVTDPADPYFGKPQLKANIINAINNDPSLSAIVTADLDANDDITLTGIAPGVPFTANISANNDLNTGNITNNTGTINDVTATATNYTSTAIPTSSSTPVSSASTAAYGVYVPASNWGIEQWDASSSWQAGDRVIETDPATGMVGIYEMGSNVKGTFIGQATQNGDLVLYGGQWYQATGTNTSTDTPGTSGSWSAGVNPLTNGATDVTSEYTDLTNTSIWTRTHHGELVGKTVSTDYQRGDNIFYQGKHYLYTAAIPSSDVLYNPDGNGYTEFEDLLNAGAIVENPLYVDTVGGGGAPGMSSDIYYRPNQNLEYIDRLPDSGLVRTNSIERRSDSERYPGDEIFNSRDDQFYGGLNAGNDGIYGTMDDFYATTPNSATAYAGGHIDADADNNKDLLDESNDLGDFSVADFVDFIQTTANFRARNGGTMSRLNYAGRVLEENQINLQAATSRIMDADMAAESTRMATQNVLLQASASMVAQANAMNGIVLQLLQ